MGGKILDEDDNVIFEFEDGEPIVVLLAAFIQKAKFGEKYESLILFNPWINKLLKALLARDKKFGEPKLSGAPKYHIDAGMTERDWSFSDFFLEFTWYLSNNTSVLAHHNWRNLNRDERAEFIRLGLYPHPISDVRLNDMIEDIDHNLQSSSEAYNPGYSHDG